MTQPKNPKNKQKVLKFVNTIREEIGKEPLKKMPVAWFRKEQVPIKGNTVKPKIVEKTVHYELCPIERAIMGDDKSRKECPFGVGATVLSADKGTELDAAFSKHLELSDSSSPHYNVYKMPDYCSDFVFDVDDYSFTD